MLASVYSYRVMVKSVSSCCVRGRRVLSNPVTYTYLTLMQLPSFHMCIVIVQIALKSTKFEKSEVSQIQYDTLISSKLMVNICNYVVSYIAIIVIKKVDV